ncbi:bifunctional pyr operon transcriptional regulator/uracil phosphoribosyltransferase PyrR [Malacoplasma penetrans]|uniref:Bifunctional protein PyrR n=1 Tax=Malacoplasma penetrans (strain HF-2) TaxID=272633 RepID=Q8EUX8_MALP2|nr:bifunctional pyr operon transcriptional regulator/uracil phosphoribosyltransferase PyrR [Malacoplasma penetrans]BAC44583.1 pyrimidine operon repressor [Malacoplasma penetrans HF-2]
MKVLLDESGIKKSTMRISYEIIEKNKDIKNIVLVGIKKRGDVLATRIQKNIFELEKVMLPLETLDVTFYRDDQKDRNFSKAIESTNFETDLNNKTVIIVDDVLYTGRTIRAALEAILINSRPSKIQLACLIDRGHRELPIRGDFIGKNIPTSSDEQIQVFLNEIDNKEGVEIL